MGFPTERGPQFNLSEKDPIALRIVDKVGDLLDRGAQRLFSSIGWAMKVGFNLGDRFEALIDSKFPQEVSDPGKVRLINVIDEIQSSRERAESAARVMIKKAAAERMDPIKDGNDTIGSVNGYIAKLRESAKDGRDTSESVDKMLRDQSESTD